MNKIFLIGEIGINHNGDLGIAKKLIELASDAGFDAVKFQKRNIDLVYSPEELSTPRDNPFGPLNGDLKRALEFGYDEYTEIDNICKSKNIDWFCSPWDLDSVNFLSKFNLNYNKVASCLLTIEPLLVEIAKQKKYTFISTGMSTIEEIDCAVKIFQHHKCKFELMHCNSTYPSSNNKINLNIINTLRNRYDCNVGYSGHEEGIQPSLAAAAMGATSIERHITLNRTMFGSDQAASLGPEGIRRLCRDVRIIESAMGSHKKIILDEEIPIRKKLSSPYWTKS